MNDENIATTEESEVLKELRVEFSKCRPTRGQTYPTHLRTLAAASRGWWKFELEKNRDFLQDGNLHITIYKQEENPYDYEVRRHTKPEPYSHAIRSYPTGAPGHERLRISNAI